MRSHHRFRLPFVIAALAAGLSLAGSVSLQAQTTSASVAGTV